MTGTVTFNNLFFSNLEKIFIHNTFNNQLEFNSIIKSKSCESYLSDYNSSSCSRNLTCSRNTSSSNDSLTKSHSYNKYLDDLPSFFINSKYELQNTILETHIDLNETLNKNCKYTSSFNNLVNIELNFYKFFIPYHDIRKKYNKYMGLKFDLQY